MPTPGAIRRTVVLPFRNISPDPRDEYFADGMTEELIGALSKVGGLRVIARSSAMRYKGGAKSVTEIGRELNVDTVIEGSVRKAGSKLRITVQLVEVASEEQLWSSSYDRELADIFAIQGDIARRVTKALKVHLREPEERRIARAATTDVGAYTLYLQGRFQWNARTEKSLHDAVVRFHEALEKDPAFALAYSGLADAFATQALLEFSPPTQAFPKAKAAAQKAIELDPQLAEAHASLGLVRFQYDRDWPGAEAEFVRATELNANSPTGHQFFADYLKAVGRFDEALEEMRRALELDPVSLAINTGLGHVLYLTRQYDRAIEQYQRALALDPNFFQAHLWFGRPYLEKGMFTEAIAEIQQAVTLTGGSTISLAVLGHAFASAGRTAEAREILDRLLERAKSAYVPSYWVALIYTGLGDAEPALRWLDRAEEERSSWLAWVKVEPRFDRLRGEPRFQALLHRMRLDSTPVGRGGSLPPVEEERLRSFLTGLAELRLSHYRVVDGYARFAEDARQRLKDLRQKISEALSRPTGRRESFLLWGPPGTGKTSFVREAGRIDGRRVQYVEINLAETDKGRFRSVLSTVGASSDPTLVLVDEVDSRPDEPWPYEALLPPLDPGSPPRAPVVFVLAGSSGSSLTEMTGRMGRRPKGTDLLSRVPAAHGYEIPPMTPEDRLLVVLSTLLQASKAQGRSVGEIEKVALYFIAVNPSLSNARQLREFAVHCADRIPAGDDRVKFDHLFDAGDAQNKEFWFRTHTVAPALLNAYTRFGE